MKVKILNAQYLMAIYNIPDYGNIYRAYRIRYTRGTFVSIQYGLVLCTLGPDNTDFLMKLFGVYKS